MDVGRDLIDAVIRTGGPCMRVGSLLLLVASVSLAQVDTATITGVVTDPCGAEMHNAQIRATSQTTGLNYRPESRAGDRESHDHSDAAERTQLSGPGRIVGRCAALAQAEFVEDAFSANGASHDQNVFTLDRADNNNNFRGSSSPRINR